MASSYVELVPAWRATIFQPSGSSNVPSITDCVIASVPATITCGWVALTPSPCAAAVDVAWHEGMEIDTVSATKSKSTAGH